LSGVRAPNNLMEINSYVLRFFPRADKPRDGAAMRASILLAGRDRRANPQRHPFVRVLRDAGHAVIASDLVAYDFALHFQRDFLTVDKVPDGVEAIVTNPPFHIANEFVAHALELCPRVVMLLRLAFLESTRRSPILEEAGLARIHIFRRRLPMMHREGWGGPRASSQTAFARFVWDRDHAGPPTVHRTDATTSLDRNGCSSHPSRP
jgi:hypothetical protein